MERIQRKFTNGYYPSYESDSDNSNCSENKDEKEKVADKVDTLLTNWNKCKELLKNPEN